MRPLLRHIIGFVVLVLLMVSRDASTQQKLTTSPTNLATTAQMPAVVPLFIADGDFSSTLVLVNGSAVSTYADVAVRALNGKTVATTRVEFAPDTQRQVNIRELLDSSGARGVTTGSITVVQSPDLNGVVITAVLSMTRLGSSPNYINEEIAMPSAEGSKILRAVVNKGEGPAIVAITSLSTVQQHLQVQCLTMNGITFTKALTLSAGETLLTPACIDGSLHGADFQRYAGDTNDEAHGPIGIALGSDGIPGSFAAFGLAPHGSRDSRYFTSFAFEDPQMIMSSTTVFAGVPVGFASPLTSAMYTPKLALANFSNEDAHVTVRYAETVGSTANVQDLKSVIIPARSSQELTFDSLRGDPTLQNSFLIVADGNPGDIVAKLVATSDSQLREVELLGKDLKDPQNGGNHPWSIEDGTISTLLLFNTSSTSQYFNVEISAGATLWRKAYQLQSMQTKSINLLDLTTQKVKDDKGVLLPSNVKNGQIGWHIPQPNAGRGRLLQSNPEIAMARNFSCGFVAELCEGDFSGITDYLADGQTINFGQVYPQVCANSCTGTPVGPGGAGYSYSWSSEYSSIASISGPSTDQSVNLYGVSDGWTPIDASVSDGFCYAQVQPSPPATVQTPTYFILQGHSHVAIPSVCTNEGMTGYFEDLSNFVADANGTRISLSGITPLESTNGFASGYATPSSTRTDGSFDDTPFGACYGTSDSYCAVGNGSPISHKATQNGTNYSISTTYATIFCTQGQKLTITGNPSGTSPGFTDGTVYQP